MSDTLQQYYAARAPEYDRVYAKPERQADLRAIEAWLPTLFGGNRVLEVACGTGYWTRFLAPVAREIVAVDASDETMQIARRRVAGAHVRFVRGDAYRLAGAGRGFDAAFAGFWFSHVPQSRIDEFFASLHEALAPGAAVVLLDNRYVEGSSSPIAERDAEGNTYQLRALGDGTRHRVLKNFPAEAQLRAAVAGIAADVRYRAWPYYWALEYTVPAA